MDILRRQAWAGSALRVDIARMIANAPKQSGANGASVPPASITSTSPRRMAFQALPRAIGAEAHESALELL